MKAKDTGKLIAKLRKEAGFTQASLAKALCVTDKAVSKWERGICDPDSSLLTRLSMLLDVDIEYLIGGNSGYGTSKWVGEIRVDDLEGEIAGKPLVHYLLSYFMLAGIKDIYINSKKREYIRALQLEKYGLNIQFFPFVDQNVMVVYDKFLLFGANLTRYFRSYMQSTENIIPVVDGRELPMLFTHYASFPMDWHKKNCEKRRMTRGMVYLPLDQDAEGFVQIYEANSSQKIADLDEIARNRNLI